MSLINIIISFKSKNEGYIIDSTHKRPIYYFNSLVNLNNILKQINYSDFTMQEQKQNNFEYKDNFIDGYII